MNALARAAALAAALLFALAAPAAAQHSASLVAPAWDARLTPAPTAPVPAAEIRSAALPGRVQGAGLLLLGAGLMYVTKQMEGEDGESGVPFLPLLSGTMGALTFWYGAYKLSGRD